MITKRFEQRNGFSLVEILVVMAVFAVLAVLATQSLVLTFRGSSKSESTIQVRENLSYAVSIIQRHLYNAKDVVSCTTSGNTSTITYIDEFANTVTFTCDTTSPGHIASNSAHLTSNEVDVTVCSFTCGFVSGVPPSVVLSLTAEDVDSSGIEGAQVSISTKILLRSY